MTSKSWTLLSPICCPFLDVPPNESSHPSDIPLSSTVTSTATSSTATSTQSTPVKTKRLRNKDSRSAEIQTEQQRDVIDSAVQTEKNTNEDPLQNGSGGYEGKVKKSIDANKKFLKENQGEGIQSLIIHKQRFLVVILDVAFIFLDPLRLLMVLYATQDKVIQKKLFYQKFQKNFVIDI